MQIQLRSRVAVITAVAMAVASHCSSDSTPSLGTSIYRRCSPKKKNKKVGQRNNSGFIFQRSLDSKSLDKPFTSLSLWFLKSQLVLRCTPLAQRLGRVEQQKGKLICMVLTLVTLQYQLPSPLSQAEPLILAEPMATQNKLQPLLLLCLAN